MGSDLVKSLLVGGTLHQTKERKGHENQGGQQNAYMKFVSKDISHF